MRFIARVVGDIERDMRQSMKSFKAAQDKAVDAAGRGMKEDWRTQVRGAGLGSRVANSVRYRKLETKRDDALALVYTKAPEIMRAFDKGLLITRARRKYMAIPTENAPKKGVSTGRGGSFKRITPATWPEHKLGKLIFVPERGNHPAMLVVRNVRKSFSRKTGEFRGYKLAKTKRNREAYAVMFILVPAVRVKKLLDIEALMRKWNAKIPDLLDRELVGSKELYRS